MSLQRDVRVRVSARGHLGRRRRRHQQGPRPGLQVLRSPEMVFLGQAFAPDGLECQDHLPKHSPGQIHLHSVDCFFDHVQGTEVALVWPVPVQFCLTVLIVAKRLLFQCFQVASNSIFSYSVLSFQYNFSMGDMFVTLWANQSQPASLTGMICIHFSSLILYSSYITIVLFRIEQLGPVYNLHWFRLSHHDRKRRTSGQPGPWPAGHSQRSQPGPETGIRTKKSLLRTSRMPTGRWFLTQAAQLGIFWGTLLRPMRLTAFAKSLA